MSNLQGTSSHFQNEDSDIRFRRLLFPVLAPRNVGERCYLHNRGHRRQPTRHTAWWPDAFSEVPRDKRAVFPVGSHVPRYDVALSVPNVVGQGGVKKVLWLEMSADETLPWNMAQRP
jgi:hypothetical protein